MRKRRAFTLIELLVVIAIIALLMAVLMPALSRARKQARTVTCRALLKQWGPIWYMYCNDNNGNFSNALFLDWSVRPVGVKELWTLKWHREFDARGPWTKAGGADASKWPEWIRKFKEY